MTKQINVGDTVVIRGVVTTVKTGLNRPFFEAKDADGKVFSLYNDQVSEVIPAPREPKPGEIWTAHAGTYEAKVLDVVDDHVWYRH